jgi:hypothetical protein
MPSTISKLLPSKIPQLRGRGGGRPLPRLRRQPRIRGPSSGTVDIYFAHDPIAQGRRAVGRPFDKHETMSSSKSYQTLLLSSLSPSALLIEYNQPKISNAFTLQQYHDLADALHWARDVPEIRVVVVTGKGKHYCAGKVLLPPGTEDGPTIEQEIVAGRRLGDEMLVSRFVLAVFCPGSRQD